MGATSTPGDSFIKYPDFWESRITIAVPPTPQEEDTGSMVASPPAYLPSPCKMDSTLGDQDFMDALWPMGFLANPEILPDDTKVTPTPVALAVEMDQLEAKQETFRFDNKTEITDFLAYADSEDGRAADNDDMDDLDAMDREFHHDDTQSPAFDAGLERLKEFRQFWQNQLGGNYEYLEMQLKNAYVMATANPASKRVPTILTPIRRFFKALKNLINGDRVKPEVDILSGLSAEFNHGTMTLLLGPPGAGKTALLNLLAGRVKGRRGWSSGGVYYNEEPSDDCIKYHGCRIGLVADKDEHIPFLTVRETLSFAHKCTNKNFKEQDVDIILATLGLSHVHDTIVGNDLIRGVSGGEKRRVTIGEMWASNVKVLLADRLTDGLDSRSTADIIRAIRVWCKTTQATAILSLLQPPPEVYKYFDNLCVMDKGRIVYNGPTRNAARILKSLGYEEPRAQAVANEEEEEELWDKPLSPGGPGHSRTVSEEADQFAPIRVRTPKSARVVETHHPLGHKRTFSRNSARSTASYAGHGRKYAQNSNTREGATEIGRDLKKYGLGPFAQLKLCVNRQYMLEKKNTSAIIGRVALNLLTGMMTGTLWEGTANNQTGLALRNSLIFHTCMSVILSTIGQIALLMVERPVFYKQKEARFYRTLPYWVATNLFQTFIWAFLEVFLIASPIYWLSGLQKDVGRYFFFCFVLYLLNITSGILLKIVAILSPTLQTAQSVAGLVQVVLFVFSGYLIPWKDLPGVVGWVRWLSPQSYAYAALMISEFRGTEYICDENELVRFNGVCPFTSGDAFLENDAGLGPGADQWLYTGLLALFWAILFAIGTLLLEFFKHQKKISLPSAPANITSRTTTFLNPARVTLSWENLMYSVAEKRGLLKRLKKEKVEEKVLLKSISGYAKPGTMTALMGPSGAGKTTLLNVLGGRKCKGTITGDILVNGFPKAQGSFVRIAGYVEQFDSNSPKLTVRESLEYAGKLQLPSNEVTHAQISQMVDTNLQLLQLVESQRERVQDLNVDQRKRVSIGVELMGNPSILFLDEPTTGMDALGAQLVMHTVHHICKKLDLTVICTIHQPAKNLFFLFDRLYLMQAGGELVFFGDLETEGSGIINYLSSLPETRPIHSGTNPANWMLDTVAGESKPGVYVNAFKKSEDQALLDLELESIRESEHTILTVRNRYPISYWRQLVLLLKRSSIIYIRSPSYNLVRCILTALFAAIFSLAYWRLGWEQNDIFLRLSYCYTTAFYIGLTFLMSGLSVHLSERAIFYREQASAMYHPIVYGLSYKLAEIPYVLIGGFVFLLISWFISRVGDSRDDFSSAVSYFFVHYGAFALWLLMCTYLGHAIAAISPNFEVANALGPGLASWLSSFCGFYLPGPAIPSAYIWIYWLDPFRWTFEQMAANMFADTTLYCAESELRPNQDGVLVCPITDGNVVLEIYGLEVRYWADTLVVGGYIVAWSIITLFGLSKLRFGK